jgi:hypothetical protein
MPQPGVTCGCGFTVGCAELLRRLDGPFYSTLRVVTQAVEPLVRYTGAPGQAALWQ